MLAQRTRATSRVRSVRGRGAVVDPSLPPDVPPSLRIEKLDICAIWLKIVSQKAHHATFSDGDQSGGIEPGSRRVPAVSPSRRAQPTRVCNPSGSA